MFVRDSINTFLLRCGVFGLAFWISIIVSNLGQEVKGVVAVVFFATDIVKLVSLMGLDAATVYYLRKGTYDYDSIARNLNLVAPLLFVVWAAILLPVFYLLHSLNLFGEIEFKYICMCFMIAPLGAIMDIQINFCNGSGEIRKGNLVSLSFSFFYLAFLAGIVFLVHKGVWGVLTAYASAFAMSSVFGVLLNMRRSRGRRGFEFDKKLLKDLSSWGIRSTSGALARKISSRTDLLLTNYFIAVTSAGIYSVALNWAELSLFIPFILHYVLFPHASGRDRESSIKLTNRVSRLSVLILLAMAVGICFIFPFMEKLLYKPDYSQAIYPLIVVMPGVIFTGLFRILMGGIDGLGRPQYGTYASFAALVSTITLNIILIPRFGMIGAASATTLTAFLSFIMVALYYRRLSGARWSEFLAARWDDLAGTYRSIKDVLLRREEGR